MLTKVKKYVNFVLYRIKNKKGEIHMCINDEICKLRNKLNDEIIKGVDYKIIYQTSVELDKLIAKYYRVKS